MEKNTIQKIYRINRKDISTLKFLLESYEGIAVPRTIDDHIALVELMIAPGCYETFRNLMKDISPELGLTPVLTGYPLGDHHDSEKHNKPAA